MAIPNPSIYDLNYNQAGTLLTPPNKRKPVWLAFLTSCLSPLQWLRDSTFNDYANGINAALYNPSTTYNLGDKVINYDLSVWENIYYNGPITGKQPGTSDINNIPYWYLKQNNFLGVRTRMRITGQQLSLEHYLNILFAPYGTSFVQPTSYGSYTYPDSTVIANDYLNKSSIYIQQKAIDNDGFFMGQQDGTSSDLSQLDNDQHNINNNLGNNYNTGLQYNFIVWVPTTLLSAIDSNTAEAKKTISGFVQNYSLYGLTFNIQGY